MIFYPTMENKQIYLWIKEYKEIGLSVFPSAHKFDNIFREVMISMSTDNQLCFRRLVISCERSNF